MSLVNDDLYPVSLVGKHITTIALIGPIRVVLDDYTIQIEEPEFDIQDGENIRHVRFNPAASEEPIGLDALGKLFGQEVTSAKATEIGVLRVELRHELTLILPAGTSYEPWSLRGPAGTLISLPSGGLTCVASQ
jgi:hypothetical protein